MIKKYVKKPIPVEAIQWDHTNAHDIAKWSNGVVTVHYTDGVESLEIKTLEGVMRPQFQDYVVFGTHGEYWFIRKAIFEENYVEV